MEVYYCIHESTPPVPILSQTIQSIPLVHSLQILFLCSSHLCLGLASDLSLRFSHQNPVCTTHMCYMPRQSRSSGFITQIICGVYRSLVPCYVIFSTSVAPFFLDRSYLLQHPMIKHPSLYSSFNFRDQVSYPYKTRGKITVLCILVFVFFDRKLEDNDTIHSPSSTCSKFFHEWNSDLLGLFPNNWPFPNLERISYLSLYCDFILHSDYKTWTHISFYQHSFLDKPYYQLIKLHNSKTMWGKLTYNLF